MSDQPPPDAEPKRYDLTFLTDQWEWDEEISAGTLEAAVSVACDALKALIREEKPELACVTLKQGGAKIGVWDWVEAQPYWSWL